MPVSLSDWRTLFFFSFKFRLENYKATPFDTKESLDYREVPNPYNPCTIKGIFSDSNNIFLRHKSKDINKKVISKILVDSNFTFTSYVWLSIDHRYIREIPEPVPFLSWHGAQIGSLQVFPCNQNNHGSSGVYVTCIYFDLRVKINTSKMLHDALRSQTHLFCFFLSLRMW